MRSYTPPGYEKIRKYPAIYTADITRAMRLSGGGDRGTG